MTKQDYQTKLRQFNSTPKYKAELDFLTQLMQPKKGDHILDYGCGLGTAVRHIRDTTPAESFGYDVNNYRDQDDPALFRNEYFFKFNKVYFLHSIAHVPKIHDALDTLKTLLNPSARIYVITPNRTWLDAVSTPGYIPDPTVVQHFDLADLRALFSQAGFNVLNSGQFGTLNNWVNERLFLEVCYE